MFPYYNIFKQKNVILGIVIISANKPTAAILAAFYDIFISQPAATSKLVAIVRS